MDYMELNLPVEKPERWFFMRHRGKTKVSNTKI